MSTKIFTLIEFHALDKALWSRALIRRWNYRFGHIQKIPVRSMSIPLLGEKKKRKKRQTSLIETPHLSWDEVPTRLPYVFGRHPPKWVTKALDPTMVYVDEDFLFMVKREQWRREDSLPPPLEKL